MSSVQAAVGVVKDAQIMAASARVLTITPCLRKVRRVLELHLLNPETGEWFGDDEKMSQADRGDNTGTAAIAVPIRRSKSAIPFHRKGFRLFLESAFAWSRLVRLRSSMNDVIDRPDRAGVAARAQFLLLLTGP